MRFVLFLVATLAIAGDFTTSLADTYPYSISAITTDAAGNTYIVGSRALGGSFTSLLKGGIDIFVSKLDPNGNLLFTDTFAGSGGYDTGNAIALDPSGNIYIAGNTSSIDFPLSKALQTQPSIFGTGFIMKLSNDGSTILYSTYFGGTLGYSTINALATDAKSNLYLTGTTTSPDFPHTAGMPFGPAYPLEANVMLTSISASGDKILFSGVLLGLPGSAQGQVGVGVDAAGNAYFVGNGSANTGFAAKVDAAGTGLSYLTSLPDIATAMAVDPAGNVYVAEYGLLSHSNNGWLIKLNPAGSAILWTNDLGNDAGKIQSLTIDAGGNLWAAGTALSSAFPGAGGWSTGTDFLVRVNPGGSQLTFSQLFPAGTVQQALALDGSGLIHAAGQGGLVSAISLTASPTTKIFAFQNAFGGSSSARVSPAEVISIYGPNIGPATSVTAVPTNGFFQTTLGGVQIQFNGVNIPLLYVSANQINAVVPMELNIGDSATVRIISGMTATTPSFPVWLTDPSPQPYPAVLNQDGTLNSQANPAKASSIVTFYATGFQTNFSPLTDGQVATVAHDACGMLCPASGSGATIVYAGAAPGIVAGVTQINMRLPAGMVKSPTLDNFFPFGSINTPPVAVWVGP